MDKLKAVIFVIAVASAFGGAIIVQAQQEEIAKLKEENAKLWRYRERMDTWSGTMVDIINEHHKNGGEFRLSPEMMNTVDAYIIFAKNGMA